MIKLIKQLISFNNKKTQKNFNDNLFEIYFRISIKSNHQGIVSYSKEKSERDAEIIKNFFMIWFVKIFISSDYLRAYYYQTFEDENENFSLKKANNLFENIYEKITTYNMTTIRPNNLK